MLLDNKSSPSNDAINLASFSERFGIYQDIIQLLSQFPTIQEGFERITLKFFINHNHNKGIKAILEYATPSPHTLEEVIKYAAQENPKILPQLIGLIISHNQLDQEILFIALYFFIEQKNIKVIQKLQNVSQDLEPTLKKLPQKRWGKILTLLVCKIEDDLEEFKASSTPLSEEKVGGLLLSVSTKGKTSLADVLLDNEFFPSNDAINLASFSEYFEIYQDIIQLLSQFPTIQKEFERIILQYFITYNHNKGIKAILEHATPSPHTLEEVIKYTAQESPEILSPLISLIISLDQFNQEILFTTLYCCYTEQKNVNAIQMLKDVSQNRKPLLREIPHEKWVELLVFLYEERDYEVLDFFKGLRFLVSQEHFPPKANPIVRRGRRCSSCCIVQ